MLSPTEREALAMELVHLRDKLVKEPAVFLRDVPDILEDQIREQAILGSLTSDGLERVNAIIDRINWAIYYLNDLDFLPQPGPTATPAAGTTDSAHREETESASDRLLNFGPFDPRS